MTEYAYYEDRELFRLFRTEVWFGDADHRGLTTEQKQQALQELENRAAEAYGAQAVPVELKDMQEVGYYSPAEERIYISKTLVENGTLLDKSGREYYHPAMPCGFGSNLRCMSNIFHEGWHSAQHQSAWNDRIYYGDAAHQRAVAANLRAYLQADSDYDLYRIQLVEREANEAGYRNVAAAMGTLEEEYGTEPALEGLRIQIPVQYERALERAQLHYGGDVQESMQRAMNDVSCGGVIRPQESAGYYATRSMLTEQELQELQKQWQTLSGEERMDCERQMQALEAQRGQIRAASEEAQAVRETQRLFAAPAQVMEKESACEDEEEELGL